MFRSSMGGGAIFIGIFASLLSWWGLFLIAALDSSMVFFLPLAVDLAVIVLASRSPGTFWLYPFIGAAGSVCGAGSTFYAGRRLGEAGLDRLISPKRLVRVQRRIKEKGAVAAALLDLIPPPFPFTAFILAAGAFRVSAWRFFMTFAFARLLRFGVEAALAFFYGRQITSWLQSDVIRDIAVFITFIAMVGAGLFIFKLVRNTRSSRSRSRSRSAA